MSYLTQVGDAQYKADGVQNVGFSATIQACDGVEIRIEVGHHNPLGIGLEPFNGNFLDVHILALLQAPPIQVNSSGKQ
jgi:hypothetical protein